MTSIKSVEHCTCNENGTEQITIYYEKTFWQSLFNKPATIKIYVYVNGDWVNKKTRKRVTQKEWFLLEQVETSLRYDKIDTQGHLRRGRSTRRYSKKKDF
jgi:hypothetical protein